MSPPRPGRVRIVGGRWRGRRLPVPDLPGLRPTPDRVRETLFNWLSPIIEGAACLDLFAGSGALGLEAASRGAARVVLVDENERVVAGLRELVAALGGAGVEVQRAEALAWLRRGAGPFDVAFLDPPFHRGLIAPACALIEQRGLLAPGGYAYLEAGEALTAETLPAGWEVVRSGRAGDVRYHLARRPGPATADA
ncbi:MAG: 16S rRNA (guanine(966)-N(2))-methyltransferase RsmD [Gammaproteobacteria bacterium]|nr:16S rRNA (guanine(966)-N(2))-methyltransferase RsmD [Gammaproteobacteria bacterium]